MLNPGPLASYIGFTEDEVSALCQKYGQNFEEVRHGTTAICLEIIMYTIQMW